MDRLEITEYHPEGLHVLIVRGELDIASVGMLCAKIARLREDGASAVAVVDLGELSFCDSTGLRGLIGEAREIEISGGRIRVVAPRTSIVRRLFDVCGIDQVLSVDPDRTTAIIRARATSVLRRARPATPAAAR
jgi:anti-anti-sigma factor